VVAVAASQQPVLRRDVCYWQLMHVVI